MSLIITATDFSETSLNAVQYACGIASSRNARLLIIHSYLVPVLYSEIPMSALLVNETQHDAETQMDILVKQLAQANPQINVKGWVVYGDFIDAINDFKKENLEPGMVVLGNSRTENSGSWPDNTVTDALRKIRYPVLAIPPDVKYKAVEKICFAYDNKAEHDYAALDEITRIAQEFQAEFHVLNVQADVHNQDNEPDINAAAKERLNHANPKYHILYGAENIDKAIESFVEENQIDLLIIFPRRHSIFEAFFHHSHTRAAASHIKVPVLAIHDR